MWERLIKKQESGEVLLSRSVDAQAASRRVAFGRESI
jgi:hypothetical protein